MVIQYRPTVAEIDLDALRHNVREVFKRVPQGTQVMSVVKANAYGHGALFCSRTLKKCGVTKLAVATLEEGIELRDGGIQGDIYVLDGLAADSLPEFSNYRLKPVIHQIEEVRRLGVALKESGKKLSCHLKMDTGMGRLGFLPSEIEPLTGILKQYGNLEVEGVLTHLACADEENAEPTDRQFVLFDRIRKIFAEKGVDFPCYHIANSASIIDGRIDAYHCVRPGIMLYGSYPHPRQREKISLKPVMTVKSRIISLKKFLPGSPLSYGGTFVTKRESLVAVLPIGYADGYPRLLSNRGEVLVQGQRAPVVGRVCMDLTLVDVTDIPGVQLGDEVVLMGEQAQGRILAEEIAEWAQTISYEIFCGISSRVPRIYRNL